MKFFCKINLLLSILMLGYTQTNFAQVLDMGSIVNFAAYSGNGEVANTGVSHVTGNLGTHVGPVSGFGAPSTLNGHVYMTNAMTQQGKVDLLNIYIHLNDMPVTNTSHSPVFGGGETILPGVYKIAGAGSLDDIIILDGLGDNNAFFVIKFEGGFSVASNSTILLRNGTRSCNVFWVAEGAISVGSSVAMRGNVIAHPGAVSFGVGSNIEGRMLSSEGAISFNSGTAEIPTSLTTVPVNCVITCETTILGTASNFALFSSNGATSNAGISAFIGNLGSNSGAVTGFESSLMVGTIESANSITNQAKIDLNSGYEQLMLIQTTDSSHSAVFGNGETIIPGVYRIDGEGSIAGKLTLDGLQNPDALFIFRFSGALSVAAQSKVILINQARRCNIFWVAEGAISMGTFSYMKGNLIAHDAANSMAANGNLEGRMFSTLGAVSFSTGVVYITYSLCSAGPTLPINLSSFSGSCEKDNIILKWSTNAEQSCKYFIVERSIDGINWQEIDKIIAAGNSAVDNFYTITDKSAVKFFSYMYRLNRINYDGTNTYGNIINVKKCKNEFGDFVIYPTLSTGIFNVIYDGDKSQVSSFKIFNENGIMVYKSMGYQSKFDLSTKPAGMYFVRIQLNSKVITHKFMLIK